MIAEERHALTECAATQEECLLLLEGYFQFHLHLLCLEDQMEVREENDREILLIKMHHYLNSHFLMIV